MASWLLGSAIGFAQTPSLTGTVTDAQNAVVTRAEVVLTATPGNTETKTQTNAEGRYTFAGLKSGSYELRVTAAGFQNFERSVEIANDRLANVDISLVVNPLAQSTTVVGTEALSASVSDVHSLGPLTDRPAINTPYTTFTLSGDLLANSFVNNSFMVERIAPGTGIDDFARYDQISFVGFRGIAGVLLINGIRQGDTYGVFMENVGAVQTLSGYSSFLYGMNAIGGLEDFQLKRPTAQPIANLTLTDEEGRGFIAHADLSQQLRNGLFGYRVNLMGQTGGTAVDNQSYRRYLASLGFDFKPTDKLQIRTDVYFGESKLDGLQPFLGFGSGGLPILLPLLDPRHLWAPQGSFSHAKTTYVSVGANYRISDNFSIRAGWDHKDTQLKEVYTEVDEVNLNAAQTAPVNFDTFDSAFASEPTNNGAYAYLDGKLKTHGIEHSFFAGVNGYWLVNHSPLFNDIYTGSIATSTSEDIGNFDGTSVAPFYNWGDFTDVLHQTLPNYYSTFLGWAKSGTTDNYSLAFGDTVTFNRHWIAMVGLDYAHIHTVNYNAVTSATTSHQVEGAVTPSASLLYKPISNLTTYFTYMQEVAPGPTVGATYQNANAILAPFHDYEYEEGVKYQFPKGMLLTAAWYNLNIESAFSSNAPLQTGIFEETGREVHKGLDLTFSGRITDSLALFGGYSYLHARLTNQAFSYLNGQQPAEEPPNLWKLTAEYKLPLVKNLILTGGTYFNGASDSTTTSPTQPFDVKYPGYTQIDLGARYTWSLEKLKMTYRLDIANLTDNWQTSYGDFNHGRTFNLGVTFGFL